MPPAKVLYVSLALKMPHWAWAWDDCVGVVLNDRACMEKASDAGFFMSANCSQNLNGLKAVFGWSGQYM